MADGALDLGYHSRETRKPTTGQQYSRPCRFGALPGMRLVGVLVDRADEQAVCSSGYHLHLLHGRCTGFDMGGCCSILAQPLRCPFRPWTRHWHQIRHRTHLCGRMRPCTYSRGSGHAVASLDGLWYYGKKVTIRVQHTLSSISPYSHAIQACFFFWNR